MNSKTKHPKQFYSIFMLEIWERFGYYAVASILSLFFVKKLGLPQHHAFILFGAYAALIYTFIAIGGYIGDHVLGAKRTILLGLITLFIGYMMIGFGNNSTIYLALGIICVGTGLFKSNPSSLLSKYYSHEQPEVMHNAFTLFYMAINIGSVIALFVSPIISSKFGFNASFVMSGIGILLAIVSFYTIRNDIKHVSTNAGMQALSIKKLFLVILGIILCSLLTAFLLKKVNYAQIFLVAMVIIVTAFYLKTVVKNHSIVRRRMMLGLILMFEAVFFQILYGQMQTSINFFAINNVSPSILGFSVNPQSFQSLNPFWIIVLSPLLSYFYVKLGNKGLIYSIHNKFATGMLLCGLSFVSLFISKYFANEMGSVNSLWLVLSYGLGGVGELMISALGVAMVAELVPGVISGFVMGMWFSYLSIGNLLSGYVASLVALPKVTPSKFTSLALYTSTFLKIGIITIVISLIMFSLSRYKNRLWAKK